MKTFAQLVKSNQDRGEVLLNHQHYTQLPSAFESATSNNNYLGLKSVITVTLVANYLVLYVNPVWVIRRGPRMYF